MRYLRILMLAWSVAAVTGSRMWAGEETQRVAFSADRKSIVFIRSTPKILVETALGQNQATEIWTAKPDGRDARMLLRGHAGSTSERTLAGFSGAQFSPDGLRIYFLSDAWVTSSAVHVLDLRSGVEKYLCPGNSLEVVPRGKYAGYLMVEQHRYAMGGGSYDWLWLITPEGNSDGLISMDDPAATEAFRRINFKPEANGQNHFAQRLPNNIQRANQVPAAAAPPAPGSLADHH